MLQERTSANGTMDGGVSGILLPETPVGLSDSVTFDLGRRLNDGLGSASTAVSTSGQWAGS